VRADKCVGASERCASSFFFLTFERGSAMPKAAEAIKDPTQQVKVRWSTTHLKSTYANFCNATSTREEVVLNFGVNQNWERTPADMEIDLEHRIVLSPFAAKRLNQLLSKLIAEYEARYGELK
jgi:hypothetical protein